MDLFTNPELLDRYLEEHSSPEDPVLSDVARHTYLKEVHPRMLSGHIMGSFLTLISKLVSPSLILEIGTYILQLSYSYCHQWDKFILDEYINHKNYRIFYGCITSNEVRVTIVK